jgi:hypothetical protein
MTKRVMRVHNPSPPLVTPGGIAVSDSEKAEAFADNLETQFQLVTNPSDPAVIEMVDVALRSYFLAPARKPKLTTPEEVQEAIMGLKVSKAPGPNGIPNRALKLLPQRAVHPSGPDIQRYPPHPLLPFSVEARNSDLYT